MTMDRRTLAKLIGVGGAAALTGVSPVIQGVAQDAEGGSTLLIGKASEAVGYDPALVTATSSFEILAVVYNRLIHFDENGDAQPELAESWEMVDDLTWTFALRDGVTFHDGQPLTADDVKFTFDRIKDPATASTWTSLTDPIESIDSDGALAVTFNMASPYGPFLSALASGAAAILPMRDEPIDFATTLVGTNAFQVEEIVADTETTLVKFDGYWEDGAPLLDTITYRILPDEAARLAAVRTDDIQLTTLTDPVSIESAGTSEGVVVIEQETTDYYLLGLNCALAPFDNVQVRRALSQAIDRQAIIDAVFFGKGQVTGPVVPTMGDWALPLTDLPHYAYDPEAATALLEEAGLADLSFKILVGQTNTEFVNIALVIQDQLKEIGVTAELEQVEWGTFVDRWRAREFESFVSYNGSGDDPDRALYAAFITDGSTNAFQFSSEAVDTLLDDGRTTADPEARLEIYHQAEVALAEESPVIFISTRVGHFAVRDSVTGFAPTAAQTWNTLKDTTVS